MLGGVIFYNLYTTKISRTKDFYECDHVHFANSPISPSDKLNDPNEIRFCNCKKMLS